MNLETFREPSDPEVLEANRERFRREAKGYGVAIKMLRKRKVSSKGKFPG